MYVVVKGIGKNNFLRCHFRDNAIEEIKRLDALLEYAVRSFPHLYINAGMD